MWENDDWFEENHLQEKGFHVFNGTRVFVDRVVGAHLKKFKNLRTKRIHRVPLLHLIVLLKHEAGKSLRHFNKHAEA